jgi:class 3 adenylate cyclase
MAEVPRTRYARNGSVHLAYQVFGDGPRDLVFILSWLAQVDHLWNEPDIATMLRRLGRIARVILFDRRGSGMSDRVPPGPLEEQMDDVRAVLDAAGADRPAILSESEGAALACLFAATHPDRASALILWAPIPRMVASEDYPWGWTQEQRDEWTEYTYWHWGEGTPAELLAPSRAGDPAFRAWVGKLERLSQSPGAVRRTLQVIGDHDVRAVLPLIRTPTLVARREGDIATDAGHSRYVAEHIPGARLVELPGRDNLIFVGDMDSALGAVEEFLGAARPPKDPERILATVLFTDIVASTERAAEVGDRAWSRMLEEHRRVVREELALHDGHEVKTLGDGFLATFDGPARAIRSALSIARRSDAAELPVRAGLHTGECERDGDDVAGIAVHIAARVMGNAKAGEVLVSRTVADLVAGSGLGFASRGPTALKGVPGEWELFAAQEALAAARS